MIDEVRVTGEGPRDLGAIIAHVEQIATRRAVGVTCWWLRDDAAEWAEVHTFLPEMTREDVLADPFVVDQYLWELGECKKCELGRRLANGKIGECNLARQAWSGEPHRIGDSKLWFLVHKCLPYGEDEAKRYEFQKRRCPGPEARALEIADAESRMQDIGGGMRGVEVEDNFDAGTTGGHRRSKR